jgi:hypothetical protein
MVHKQSWSIKIIDTFETYQYPFRIPYIVVYRIRIKLIVQLPPMAYIYQCETDASSTHQYTQNFDNHAMTFKSTK